MTRTVRRLSTLRHVETRRCGWTNCAVAVKPIVAGGPFPSFCGPLCRALAAGYETYLQGGGDKHEVLIDVGGKPVRVDARKIADNTHHLKSIAAAKQAALW